jgi:hypothetical protein
MDNLFNKSQTDITLLLLLNLDPIVNPRRQGTNQKTPNEGKLNLDQLRLL